MKPKHQRLIFVCASVGFLVVAVLFTMQAFRENIVFFYSPSEIKAMGAPPEGLVRMGGLIKQGSMKRNKNVYRFIVTDGAQEVTVRFIGIPPNLLRDGQGVVAEGRITPEGELDARSVLAKHDEKYLPAEVVEKLKATGVWKGESK